MKSTSIKVCNLENRPGHSNLGPSFKNVTNVSSSVNVNNGGEGASKINTSNSNNGDTEVEAEDTMIVKREGVLVTDLLYRLHRRSTKLVDTHIICMDGYIPVHRCVLMACSNFLMDLLIQLDPTELAAICLPDFKVSQVIPLINSFYTGCVTFSKSDLNATLELISLLKTDTDYNFQLAREQDKKWSPKMRHYLENKEVNSETHSVPAGSSITKLKRFDKPSLDSVDGEKSNQSLDDLSPQSVDNGATIEVDIEEIDDPEFPADVNEESDDDIKILEILSAEPVISDVTEVAEIQFSKRTGTIKTRVNNDVVQLDDESSTEHYDEYVFSPTDVDLATNVIVRQAGNPSQEEDNGDEDKDPLELESLVFDKDFVDVNEDYHGRSYEFETIAFDETGQHKQIAQILTEPVPLVHARSNFSKNSKRKATSKAKSNRARGRKKASPYLKRLLAPNDSPPPLLFEENILGSATPPHLRRKSFEKLEEQKSRMEDIRFSNQLQKQLKMSLEAVNLDSPAVDIIIPKEVSRSKPSKSILVKDFPHSEMLAEKARSQHEKEEALLKKFEQEKRQRDEEKLFHDEEENRLREMRLLKLSEALRRQVEAKKNKRPAEAKEDILRTKEEQHKKSDDEQHLKKSEVTTDELESDNCLTADEAFRKSGTDNQKVDRKYGTVDTHSKLTGKQPGRKNHEDTYTTLEKEKRLMLEEEKRLKLEEEKRLKLEEERRLKLEEEKRLKLEEKKRLKQEEEKRLKMEEEKRLKLEEEKRQKLEEEKRQKLEEEKRLKLEEEKRVKLEEERRLKLEEENRLKMEEEYRRKRSAEEKRRKEDERRRKEETRQKRFEEERALKEQEERHLEEVRLEEEKRAAEEETARRQQREDEKRKESEEKRRKEKDARRKREEEMRVAEEKRVKQLEEEKQLEAQRILEAQAEAEDQLAIKKAEEILNLDIETQLRQAELDAQLEKQRKIQEEEDRKKREEAERVEAERRERERIEEEKRIEEELEMQIEKDMQKFDYEPSILGIQEPKRRSEEVPMQQPKSTPFFEEFVKRKQKILEEEKRRRQTEEQQQMSQDISNSSSEMAMCTTKREISAKNRLLPDSRSEKCLVRQSDVQFSSEKCSENIGIENFERSHKHTKSIDAERVQEQLKSINLSVEVEEIVDATSQTLTERTASGFMLDPPEEHDVVESSQNCGLNLSISEVSNSGSQQVYEFVDDIPVAETEIELTGDGFSAEVETEAVNEVEVETHEVSQDLPIEEIEAVVETETTTEVLEQCGTIGSEADEHHFQVSDRVPTEVNPPSPFIGEDLSLTSSSPENGLQIVEVFEEPKPKSKIKKKKNRKVREKHTQVKPQMISLLKKQGSVIVHPAERSRRSSRSSDSSPKSPEPMTLNAAAKILIKNPKKPIKVQYGSSRVTLQNPKIIISRLSSEEYKHYSFRLQRYKRMRSKQGTPPPTLTLASPETPSSSKAMTHWKTLQRDVTSSRSKSIRTRDSIDEAPPPLLEPQMPSCSKQKRSGVTPVGIENFPTVSQPACITVNDLEWYQKELKRCAHCKRKYGTHTKASSCLLNHGFRRCLICLDLVSSLDTSYELHYSKHHSVPKHRGHVACPICGKLFLFRGLQSHVTRKHLQQNEQQEEAKTPEFHSPNLTPHFYYPPPPEPQQFYNQYPQFYQPHQYSSSNSNQSVPPVEPLVLDLKKIRNHTDAKETTAKLSVRLSESEEEDDRSETDTLDGSDDGKSKGGNVYSGSTGSVLKDTNKDGKRSDSISEGLYAFKEPNREIPIELIPNPTTAFVDAELAKRAFQPQFQVEKIPQPIEKPPTSVSQLTIEKTPILQESERELPVQQKRHSQDFLEIMQPRKKYYQYNEPYQYETHHRNNDDNLHLPRVPYFPLPSAPSHIPNHHHDFFQHRPMTLHNPPYPQSHHPHMHAHLPQHQQPSSHSSHSLSSHNMDNEFPIINPGITVDESSGSVLCELMPVNYHASPIPLQQPYNSNGPKGPSAVPAPMQDLYESSNNLGLNRPAPSIFSTPPLSNTPSSTSSNAEWTSEDPSRRHHHLSHHSSHHQNMQSHHHHHQHHQWGEPLPAHRNESVISVNMEYMKIAEMDHQHHQQHQQQHSDGPVQCDRCKATFYNQEHLANHRCMYDMN